MKPQSLTRATDAIGRPPSSSPPTAKQLFEQANSERRSGRIERAMALYRELEVTCPCSLEAALSHVVLGRIHLDAGRSEMALGEFDAYLAQPQGGSLTQEAWDGKARALGRLGRFQEERAAWQALLNDSADSMYAPRARQRLRELDEPLDE